MQNPFIITSEYFSNDYFCDREAETKVLVDNIHNGRNTVLISPRRMGKSGLVSHVFEDTVIKNEYRCFSVDLFATSSLSEMVMLLSREIVSKLKDRKRKMLDLFISIAMSLKPGFKVDPVTGDVRFDLALGDILQPKTSLEEIFKWLEKSDVPCVVAIDEFQQIAEYQEKNVLGLLRTLVQKCRNSWFVFSGSRRRMMEKLFNTPSEPFYMSCSPLYLEAIDKDKYRAFAQRHFKAAEKELTGECFDWVYDRYEGHTWYVQRILNELFAWTDSNCTADAAMAREAEEYVVKIGAKTFEEQFRTLPEAQKQLLIAIAKEGKARGITSVAFVKKHSLKSPSTVQSASKALYEKETITKEGDSYFILNRFYAVWMQNNY